MLHDLQHHDPLGQQFQCPAHTPLGLGATGNRDQLGLLLAVEHPFDAGTSLLLALQCHIESLFDDPFPQRLDRPHRHAKRLGIKILYDKTFPFGSPDVTSVMRAIKAVNADLVYIGSYPGGSVGLVKAANDPSVAAEAAESLIMYLDTLRAEAEVAA